MKTTEEILERTRIAINDSVNHYLTHLVAGEDQITETQFLAEVLLSLQPWLFFTEGSMENINNLITKSAGNVNTTYNLTSLFFSRLSLNKEEYKALLEHLSNASDVGGCEDPSMSFMAREYRDRLIDGDAAMHLLVNNRKLVFLYAFMLFVDTLILERVLK